MGVISDKKIKDLEEELIVMKSSWLEPSQHEQLQQKLISVTEAKETFEVDFLINVFVSFMQIFSKIFMQAIVHGRSW